MLTWECLVDTVRDDLPFILSVSTGCAISASCLEKRKHFYLRVALTILLTFCWMYGTRPYVGLIACERVSENTFLERCIMFQSLFFSFL